MDPDIIPEEYERSPLLCLPLDILKNICDAIDQDAKSFDTLSKTCSLFHQLSLPVTVRTIVVRGSDYAKVLQRLTDMSDCHAIDRYTRYVLL